MCKRCLADLNGLVSLTADAGPASEGGRAHGVGGGEDPLCSTCCRRGVLARFWVGDQARLLIGPIT